MHFCCETKMRWTIVSSLSVLTIGCFLFCSTIRYSEIFLHRTRLIDIWIIFSEVCVFFHSENNKTNLLVIFFLCKSFSYEKNTSSSMWIISPDKIYVTFDGRCIRLRNDHSYSWNCRAHRCQLQLVVYKFEMDS